MRHTKFANFPSVVCCACCHNPKDDYVVWSMRRFGPVAHTLVCSWRCSGPSALRCVTRQCVLALFRLARTLIAKGRLYDIFICAPPEHTYTQMRLLCIAVLLFRMASSRLTSRSSCIARSLGVVGADGRRSPKETCFRASSAVTIIKKRGYGRPNNIKSTSCMLKWWGLVCKSSQTRISHIFSMTMPATSVCQSSI